MIRDAQMDDIAAIAEVHCRTWKETYKGIVHDKYLHKLKPKYDQVRSRMENVDRRFFVMVPPPSDGNAIGGFIEAGKSRNLELADAQIHSIYILPRYQGQGVGKDLMEKAWELFRERIYGTAFVSVLSANGPAVQFYLRMGGQLKGHDCVIIEGITYLTDTYFWQF
jgi:ribosomal protein S18 acetylase RimI-like enzyme